MPLSIKAPSSLLVLDLFLIDLLRSKPKPNNHQTNSEPQTGSSVHFVCAKRFTLCTNEMQMMRFALLFKFQVIVQGRELHPGRFGYDGGAHKHTDLHYLKCCSVAFQPHQHVCIYFKSLL